MEILVKVIPWSKKIEVEEIWKDLLSNLPIYKIKLTAKPVNNQANKQLIDVLVNYFNTKKRFIEILKWDTSRLKKVRILEDK